MKNKQLKVNKKNKKVKDNPLNRLRAVESLAAIIGEEAEMSLMDNHYKKWSRKELNREYERVTKALTDCYVIAHGAVSKCCKGRGQDLLEPAMRMYYEKDTHKLLFSSTPKPKRAKK